MRCLACNRILTDLEASRKFADELLISNPEEKYVGLCSKCLRDTDIHYTENTSAKDETYEEEEYFAEESHDYDSTDSRS